MGKKEILKTLNEVFCEIFDDDELVIDEKTSASDIEDWDSLEHINLIMACEKKFGVKFDMPEIDRMKNVKEMAELIGEKLSKKENV